MSAQAAMPAYAAAPQAVTYAAPATYAQPSVAFSPQAVSYAAPAAYSVQQPVSYPAYSTAPAGGAVSYGAPTYVTPAAAPTGGDLFSQLDANRDGVVSRSEFAQGLSAAPAAAYTAPQSVVTYAPQYAQPPTYFAASPAYTTSPAVSYGAPTYSTYGAPAVGGEVLGQMDANRDGVISQAEYAQAMAAAQPAPVIVSGAGYPMTAPGALVSGGPVTSYTAMPLAGPYAAMAPAQPCGSFVAIAQPSSACACAPLGSFVATPQQLQAAMAPAAEAGAPMEPAALVEEAPSSQTPSKAKKGKKATDSKKRRGAKKTTCMCC